MSEEAQEQELEVTPPDSESDSSPVKEDVSEEDGDKVPSKNRFAELKRKNERLEEKLDALTEKLENISIPQVSPEELRGVQYGNQAPVQQPVQTGYQTQVPQLTEEQLKELEESPEKQYQYVAQTAAQKASNDAIAYITRNQSDAAAYRDFPELSRKGSALQLEVQGILQEWGSQWQTSQGQYGRNTVTDPSAVYDAAEKAYARLIRAGKISPKSKEDQAKEREKLVSDSSGVSGRNPVQSKTSTELTDSQEFFHDLLGKESGLSRTDYKKRIDERNAAKRKRR